MLTNTSNEGNSRLISNLALMKTLKEVVPENNNMLQEIKGHLFEIQTGNLSSIDKAKSMIMKSHNPNLLILRQVTSLVELLLIDNSEVSLECIKKKIQIFHLSVIFAIIIRFMVSSQKAFIGLRGTSFASRYCFSKLK